MAEALLGAALQPAGITVRSAGLAALEDYPADEMAIELMTERGIDIAAHRARQLTPDLLGEADLVLVMEKAHKRALELNEPTARGKIYRLCGWQDADIPDPYRQPREAFAEALRLIDTGVADWTNRLTVGAPHGRDREGPVGAPHGRDYDQEGD